MGTWLPVLLIAALLGGTAWFALRGRRGAANLPPQAHLAVGMQGYEQLRTQFLLFYQQKEREWQDRLQEMQEGGGLAAAAGAYVADESEDWV